jgi:hypothetical protein
MSCINCTSTTCGIVTFFGSLAILLWLGISMLVPQEPFHSRNIAGGVCIIIFGTLISVVAGILAWFFTGGCCVCYSDEDDCC